MEGKQGFSEQEQLQLKGALAEVQTALETKQKANVEAALKEHMISINDSIKKFGDWQTEKTAADVENQKALDSVLAAVKSIQDNANARSAETPKKPFMVAFAEALMDPDNQKGIASVGRGNRFKMPLKGRIDLSSPGVELIQDFGHKMDQGFDKKVMTTAPNITGTPTLTYQAAPAIIPSQKVNARDLIPTIHSDTGVFVNFKETAPSGPAGLQSEGIVKNSIDFNFTEVRTVAKYVSGFTRFSKQLMRNLPWLQSTLPRLLQREFFKVENRDAWDVIYTALGFAGVANGANGVSTETDPVKKTSDWLVQLLDTDFSPTIGLMRYGAMNRLNKQLYNTIFYPGNGGFMTAPNGTISIMGIPIVPVTWIPSQDKFLSFDPTYFERIEVESLAVEFFEQDSDNVQKNLITARIECFEEFNPMLPAAFVVGDYGYSATS